MSRAKKTRKFATTKRLISQRDARLKKNQPSSSNTTTSSSQPKANSNNNSTSTQAVRPIPQQPTSLFFTHNTALSPPYKILLDTNFFNHCIQNKLDLLPSLTTSLLALCTPLITPCIASELEKLGPKYRLALRLSRDPKIDLLPCGHKNGGYADDCIVDTVVRNRIYLVGTNDRELKRRIRKVPGVPILSVKRGGVAVERLPDAPER